ncbi:MAG: helix-turn-helix domain-containing protein [Planctomycetes bacterium]|nr:helix-turn-helix domain-containing protein [Planctomycetota bacterium]
MPGPPRHVVPRPDRVRSLRGVTFGWLDARLLRDGWLRALPLEALSTYVFLCLAADRQGVSFYRRARLGQELGLDERQVVRALDELRALDLVAYAPFHPGAPDGFHQVLALPGGAAPPSQTERLVQALAARLASPPPSEPRRS